MKINYRDLELIKPLSKDDELFIDKTFHHRNILEISRELNTNIVTVWDYAKKNGYYDYLDDEELALNIIDMYDKKYRNAVKLSEKFNLTISQVYNILIRNGRMSLQYWRNFEIDILNEYSKVVSSSLLTEILIVRTKASVDKKISRLNLSNRKRDTWKDEEKQFLLENYGRMSIREISEALDRTENSIRIEASILNISRSSYEYKFTEDDKKIILQYHKTMSLANIHRTFFKEIPYHPFNAFFKKTLGIAGNLKPRGKNLTISFSEEDIALIKEKFNDMTINELNRKYFPDIPYSNFSNFCRNKLNLYKSKMPSNKSKKYNFSEEDIALIKEKFYTTSLAEINRKYFPDVEYVKFTAFCREELNLSKRDYLIKENLLNKKNIFSDKDIEIIRKYYDKISLKEINNKYLPHIPYHKLTAFCRDELNLHKY